MKQEITYQKLYNRIEKLQNSKYSDGIVEIVAERAESGFGIRKFNDGYFFGVIGWAGSSLDDFGFDMQDIAYSFSIEEVIKSYLKYFIDFNYDNNLRWENEKDEKVFLKTKHPNHTKIFEFFKKGSFSIILDLEKEI